MANEFRSLSLSVAGEGRTAYPLMMRGSSIWWRGQIDFGF